MLGAGHKNAILRRKGGIVTTAADPDHRESSLMKALEYCLKDFSTDERALAEGSAWDGKSIQVETSRLPLPSLVFICMVMIKGYSYWGKDEKLLWTIPFRYKDCSLLLSHRKFGLELLSNSTTPPSQGLVDRIIKQLNKAVKITDKLMQPHADKQVKAGNVTVVNSYHKLNMMYRFFRRKAKERFRRATSAPTSLEPSKTGHISPLINWRVQHEREGAYYSAAMIDAFFSRLEHVLVLVLPFVGFDPVHEDLVAFISSSWNNKFKRIFDIEHNQLAKSLYDQLDSAREKYRNPITHGYFEKSGASLYFHIPNLGAIPVRLSKFREGLHYSFLPISETSLEEVCYLFDRVDVLLRSGMAGKGFVFAKTGLNIAFDDNSLAEYRSACSSKRSLRNLIDREAQWDAIASNMDW